MRRPDIEFADSSTMTQGLCRRAQRNRRQVLGGGGHGHRPVARVEDMIPPELQQRGGLRDLALHTTVASRVEHGVHDGLHEARSPA